MFVSDSGNSVVRKVDAGTSIINRVAGSATPGYSGDNGPATSASLMTPEGLAFDAAGNLFITDDGAFSVRKVSAGTGLITTVAGGGVQGYSGDNGPATLANLSSEVDGVVVGCRANLYLPNLSNERRRKVSWPPGT